MKYIIILIAIIFSFVSLQAQDKYKNSQGEWKAEDELPGFKLKSDYSKPTYNNQGQLIKEEFWGCTGEMCIKWIEYKYDEKGQLTEELYFYTGTVDPDDEAKYEWVNEYYYDADGFLAKTQYKFKRSDSEYRPITTFNYDKTKKLFGENGKTPNIPYTTKESVLIQQLYSQRHPLKK